MLGLLRTGHRAGSLLGALVAFFAGTTARKSNFHLGTLSSSYSPHNLESCAIVSYDAVRPAGLAWDHASTIYIADEAKPNAGGNGGVYKIPAGERRGQTLELVVGAPGARGIAYLQVSQGGTAGGAADKNRAGAPMHGGTMGVVQLVLGMLMLTGGFLV